MAEALDHAVALMTEEGVGALSVSEVARRMGIRGPSLYKYFPSRHAMYDALFARGLAAELAAVRAAIDGRADRGCRASAPAAAAVVRWAVEHPALAQLLHWRPVPGFEPSPGVFAPRSRTTGRPPCRVRRGVRLGQLAPDADSDDVVRLYTVLLSGLISQQLANEPGVPYADGAFSRLTDASDRPVPVRPPTLRRPPCRPSTATRSAPSSPRPPEEVYDLVADVTRMSEFSPEVVSCRWLDGATGPAVGARFEAVNVQRPGKTLEEPPGRHRGRARPGVRLQPDRALRRHDRVALPLRARGRGHASRRELRGASGR